jgi:glycosyltransferase involved in cell wall biosynthesis
MDQNAPRLKILMISPAYFPSQGGVQVQMQLLVDELVKRGYQITIITKEIPGAQKIEKTNGIHLFRLKDSKISLDVWNGFFFIRKNSDEIKKIIADEHIDLIHVHHFEMSCSFVYLLKKIVNIPIILTVHTALHIDNEYLKLRINIKEPLRWIIRIFPILWFEKKSIRASDFIITVSKNLECFCRSLRNDNHCKMIPNAISLQQFNPDIMPANFNINEFTILCPGRISPEKGQIYLVDALKIIREKVPAQVIFMGSEDPIMGSVIKKRIRLLNLDEYVHFYPPQNHDNTPPYYKAADIIVIPSLSESFGLTILENMALGNVVVASEIGGVPDLIENGKTGVLVPPANPQKLADAIIFTLTNDDLQKEIRKNASEKAKGYKIENIVGCIEKCYQKYVFGIDIIAGDSDRS